MMAYAVKTRTAKKDDNLVDLFLESIKAQGLALENGDVIAIASKIVALTEKRVVKLADVKPSPKAESLARKYCIQSELAELILQEAEKIYGGVEKAILTLKNCILTANAGIDNKNAPLTHVVLWPNNPARSAEKFKGEIKRKTGKSIAVLIVDSGLIPLRIGTVGLALAVAGFKPIKDHRGKKDIFGRQIVITRHAVADDLACVAHLMMGEAAEKTPFVLIRDACVELDDGVYDGEDMMMPSKDCLFIGTFLVEKHD